jgi:hypothetical protein
MTTATFHHISEYQTRSLALVAVLQMRGFAPKGTGQHWTGKKTFVYDRSAAFDATIAAYLDGSLLVSARDYARLIHEVKLANVTRPAQAV